MKKKLFFSGIISILLIFTFLAGCDNGTTNEVKVTEYVPSPYPSAVPTEVPIEVPGQTYGALARALLDAQEAYVKDPTQRPVVTITGQIPIQANSTVTVPDYVTLQINKGARLTIEANAILFVREFAKVNVQGELYFEQYANGDDVRQAKLVGEIVADGGTIYDKSSAGHLLQYVDKVREGGRLVFAGGTTTIAGKKETNLLGTPTFTGDGYIKLVFSDGWSKYNPVVVAAATDNIVSATPVAPIPRLRGFEVIGKVQVTGGEMVIPDSATNALDFVVKKGSELTIDAGASLMSEGTTAANVVKFVIEEGASLNVDGRFYYPVNGTRQSINYGTVTVSGTLVSDLTLTTVAVLTSFAQSNVIFKPGSSILYDRAAKWPSLPVFMSSGPAADTFQTSGKDLTVTLSKDLMSITGKNAANDTFTVKGPAAGITFTAPIVVDKAGVNLKVAATHTPIGSATYNTVTVQNGGKIIVGVQPVTMGIIAKGAGSTVETKSTFNTAATVPLDLQDGAVGNITLAAAANAIPLTNVTVTKSKLIYTKSGTFGVTIAAGNTLDPFFTGGNIFETDAAVVIADGDLKINNAEGIFKGGLELTSGSAALSGVYLTNGAKLTVNGLLALPQGTIELNKSTATLDNVDLKPAAVTDGIVLANSSSLTLSDTLTYSTNAGILTFNDAASTFKGTATNATKIVATTAITLTIPVTTPINTTCFPGFTASGSIVAGKIVTWKPADPSGTPAQPVDYWLSN